MEILFDSRVLFRIFLDCSLILEKYREFFAKLSGIFGWGDYFPNENGMDSVHG
jgi:hypothetical protein